MRAYDWRFHGNCAGVLDQQQGNWFACCLDCSRRVELGRFDGNLSLSSRKGKAITRLREISPGWAFVNRKGWVCPACAPARKQKVRAKAG